MTDKIEMRTAKFKNKRVSVGSAELENTNAIFIRFQRLLDRETLADFNENKMCQVCLEKNIVTTSLALSRESAFALASLLLDELEKNHLQKK